MRLVIAGSQGRGFTVSSAGVAAVALALSILWLLGNAGQVYACKCVVPGPPSEEMEKFDAVFAGRVVSIEHSFDPNARTVGPGDSTTIGLEVSTVWKGDVDRDMQVSTPPTGGSCGFAFEEGREYILYANASARDDEGYWVSICSRTALLGEAQADIDALGMGSPPIGGTAGSEPERNQSSGESTTWVIMLGAVAAVLLFGALSAVVWARRR